MDLIRDLELMQDLAAMGSFSAVARQREQAASSIARRLDRLEAHLGERLFNRAPTGLFLTATGARKLGEARALTTAAAAFAEREKADALSGHLTVAAPSRLGEVCIAPLIAEFLTEHPAVSIDLHLNDAIQDLDVDRIDLAVRIGGISAQHHIVRRIACNHRVLVAAPPYLVGRPLLTSVADLAGCDGLMRGAADRWLMRAPGGDMQYVEPRVRFRSATGDAVRAMAEAGLGIALKSKWDVRGSLVAGRLVHVLPNWVQADPADIMLVMPDRRLLSRRVRAFSTALEDGLKAHLSPGQE